MKTLLLVLCLIIGSESIAQNITGASASKMISIFQTHSVKKVPSKPLADGQPFTLKHFDESLPTIEWLGSGVYGPYLMYSNGQRFTLAGNDGVLDSVTIQIDTISADSVFIAISRDSLYEVAPGVFRRLINIWDDNAILARASVHANEIVKNMPVTVHFPSVAIPKEFFVVVIPNLLPSGQPTNFYTLRGDSKPARELTTENSRSAFIGVDLQSSIIFSAMLDNTFIPNGMTEAAFSDYYMTAYVRTVPAAVPTGKTVSEDVKLYPNPSSNTLNIMTPYASSDITVIDALGRAVLSLKASGENTTVDTRQLPNGVYTVKVKNDISVSTSTLTVLH